MIRTKANTLDHGLVLVDIVDFGPVLEALEGVLERNIIGSAIVNVDTNSSVINVHPQSIYIHQDIIYKVEEV